MTRCVYSGSNWEQRVQVYDFNYIIPPEDRELPDFASRSWDMLKADYPDLLNAELKLHCTCPAYLYWGSQYTLTQLDTSLEPENRFPGIRDENLERIACKHLLAVLRGFFT